MAVVTLTRDQLSGALRLGDSAEETAESERLLRYASIAVSWHSPRAPSDVLNEAAIRLASYLFDMPNAGRGAGYASAMRNSGAGSILLPYRLHRAASVSRAPTPTPVLDEGVTLGDVLDAVRVDPVAVKGIELERERMPDSLTLRLAGKQTGAHSRFAALIDNMDANPADFTAGIFTGLGAVMADSDTLATPAYMGASQFVFRLPSQRRED